MQKTPTIELNRVRRLVKQFAEARVLVIGDVMLDRYVWGSVGRISPEAPVPVVEFQRESFVPGGAANVARNLACLKASTEILGIVGKDIAAKQLRESLKEHSVRHGGLITSSARSTSVKTRIIAHQQQVVRVDRESRGAADAKTTQRLLKLVESSLDEIDAVLMCDYGKGVVTQGLLDGVRHACRERGVWLSFDPKPVHSLRLHHVSLLTPNRKEVFELARVEDCTPCEKPLRDENLMRAVKVLMDELQPALLLVTLSELGMLLCQRGHKPFHIPTVAREVYDVSGAGDTVIGSFTLAVAAGASPLEAAIISNHAAGVVVSKVGTATVSPTELIASFEHED